MTERPTVLLCTTNGVGLGHLTRTMAIADELDDAIDVVLFTLSGAVAIPLRAGFHVEHLLSPGHPAFTADQWHDLLESRLGHLVEHHRPAVLLFDGVHPYRGLLGAMRRMRRVRTIWQRRGMWKPGVGADAMRATQRFDDVVEPGDYAAAADRGLTAGDRAAARVVHPIVYRYAERLGRDVACERVGVDPADVNVLVQLGAGRINDAASLVGAAMRSLRRHDVTVTVARSELSRHNNNASDHEAGVRIVRHFPVSDLFPAFDAAVLAAGYNSFHEALGLGLPAVFAPNTAAATDDQAARAGWADEHGAGVRWDTSSAGDVDRAIHAIVDDTVRSSIRDRLATLPPPTGASEVARLIESRIT